MERYLAQAEREARDGRYETAAATLDLVLALHAEDGAMPPPALFLRHAVALQRAGRHADAAESATRYLLSGERSGTGDQEALNLIAEAEESLARQRELRSREAAAQAREGTRRPPIVASVGSRASAADGPRACEIPGFPRPADARSLGLRWCPSSVDFQLRVFALQAAGAWCGILTGSASTAGEVKAGQDMVDAACDRLDALAGRNGGAPCRCPPGYRP